MIISLLLILTVFVVGSVNLMVGQILEEETQKKELAITEHIAYNLANPLFNKDTQEVQKIIEDFRGDNSDLEYAYVKYAYVVDFNRTVVAHTFENGFPVELPEKNHISSGEHSAIQILSVNGDSIQDIGVRVIEGMDAKVYIGFNRALLYRSITEITDMIISLAAMILLFGISLSFILMWRITRPIEALVEGTKRVGDGDFDFKIDVVSHDEIGTLTDSFNQMAAKLKQTEDQIRASLKEKEVLLREIHHRVKNNLQVVSSMLNLHTRITTDKDTIDVLSESRNRIDVMALIHSQLYESSNLSEINMKRFVDRLLRNLLQSNSVQDTEINTIVSVCDRPFPISIATPVGLIINELLSNALKHAFDKGKKGKKGKIEIILTESDEKRINMSVSDDGIGLPEGFDINATGTLGLRLVKILVENQLQGTLEIISEKGTTFNIEFYMEDDEDGKSENIDR